MFPLAVSRNWWNTPRYRPCSRLCPPCASSLAGLGLQHTMGGHRRAAAPGPGVRSALLFRDGAANGPKKRAAPSSSDDTVRKPGTPSESLSITRVGTSTVLRRTKGRRSCPPKNTSPPGTSLSGQSFAESSPPQYNPSLAPPRANPDLEKKNGKS